MAISGISDIDGYVAQLIELDRSSGPIKVYTEEKQALSQRNATLTDLRTNLSAVNTQVQALLQPGSLSPFSLQSATSSNTAVATATAATGALAGTHTLLVTQLAKQSRMVSDQLTRAGGEILAAAGAGERTFRLSLDGTATEVAVTLAAGDDNSAILTKMAAAINGSDAAVAATVVNDSDTTARLVLTSDETGKAHAITLEDVSGTLLAATGTQSGVAAAGTAGGYLTAVADLDAAFTLDGLQMTRGSNLVTDALTGVSLTLRAVQSGGATPLSLSVGPDQDGIKAKVQSFLESYNTAVRFLRERTGVSLGTDATTGEVTSVSRGTLSGDATYQGLLMNLRSDVGGRIGTAAAGGPAGLPEIGIAVAADGTLSFGDEDKFSDALTKDAAAVAALFGSTDGIAVRVSNRLQSFVQTGGILDGSLASASARMSGLSTAIQLQEQQLKLKTETLRKQYLSLQEIISQMNEQQSVLAAMGYDV
jgi:flagellar hook-associated protein 2